MTLKHTRARAHQHTNTHTHPNKDWTHKTTTTETVDTENLLSCFLFFFISEDLLTASLCPAYAYAEKVRHLELTSALWGLYSGAVTRMTHQSAAANQNKQGHSTQEAVTSHLQKSLFLRFCDMKTYN